MDKLVFAQNFPFSERARSFLKETGISLDGVPESAIKRAALMISKAYKNEQYVVDVRNPSKEFLATDVVAFPVAKMFVSLMQAPLIIQKFCAMTQKNTFSYLINSQSARDVCMELADDFGLKYAPLDGKDFAAEVPLLSYMEIYFIDEDTKLINTPMEKGKVFLNSNDFARFLSEKAYKKVFDSLPIKKDTIPRSFHALAKSIDSQLIEIEKKNFDLRLDVQGIIDPNLFPPSMRSLYEAQLAGKKLSYYERLAIGAFLSQLGMDKSKLLDFFSKSPDFQKGIAEYHINRIISKKLSSPGYKKLEEYGVVVSKEEKGRYKHPLQYYRAQLRSKRRIAGAGAGAGTAKK